MFGGTAVDVDKSIGCIMRYLFVTLAFIAMVWSQLARAASQDECAIWLCLPQGFAPSACGPAHSAMIRRITRTPPKSPLPSFRQCSTDGGGRIIRHKFEKFADCPASRVAWNYNEMGGEDGTVSIVKGNQHQDYNTFERHCVAEEECYYEDVGEDRELVCPDWYHAQRFNREMVMDIEIDGIDTVPFQDMLEEAIASGVPFDPEDVIRQAPRTTVSCQIRYARRYPSYNIRSESSSVDEICR